MRQSTVEHRQALARRPYLRWQSFTLLLGLMAIWILAAYFTHGVFLEARNLSNLMRQMAVTGILSIGMLLVIVSSHIDLSTGSLVGLTGMTAALVQASAGRSLAESLLAAMLCGLTAGAVQGVLVAYVEVPSFIVTLGGLLVWRGVTKGVSAGQTVPLRIARFQDLGQEYLPSKGGWTIAIVAVVVWTAVLLWRQRARHRFSLPVWSAAQLALRLLLPSGLILILTAALNSYAGVPIPVLTFFLIALLGALVTRNTVFGRYLYAIGGNSEAARLSGINLRRQVLIVFCLMGILSATAGILYTARVGSASPDAGLLLELDAIAACVIGGASLMGGRGTVLGACLGALIIASLDNGMSLRNVPDFMQDIVKGCILVAAVAIDMFGRRRRY